MTDCKPPEKYVFTFPCLSPSEKCLHKSFRFLRFLAIKKQKKKFQHYTKESYPGNGRVRIYLFTIWYP